MCNRVYVAEKAVHPASEAPKKVNNYIKRAFDILKQETGRVHKQMDALDEVAKDLEHVHSSKIVKLNVGGHLFSTNLETLTKDPGLFVSFESCLL